MNNRKYLAIVFILAIVILAGCKKTCGPLNNGVTYKVKTYTSPDMPGIQPTVTVNYTYDNLGRLISDASGTYTYLPGMVIERINSSPSYNDSFILNGNNLAIRLNHREFYGYDNNGYLISDSAYSVFPYEYLYNISGDNAISEIENAWMGGTNDSLIQWNYANTYYSDLDPRDFGKAFLGKTGKNLIHTRTGSDGSVCIYTYNFDKEGRLVKQVCTYSGKSSGTVTYSYGY